MIKSGANTGASVIGRTGKHGRIIYPLCFLFVFGATCYAHARDTISSNPWIPLYENGRWAGRTEAWTGVGTYSHLLRDGLLIADTSSATGSSRTYFVPWHTNPESTSAVEARLMVISCSGPSGVSLFVADGVHEETLTIYPDSIHLENAGRGMKYDASSGFHTFKMKIEGNDVGVFIDGNLVINGTSLFTSPARFSPPRNECAFGCGSSQGKGEALWKWVRYSTGFVPQRRFLFPGIQVALDSNVLIAGKGRYVLLFKHRDGDLAVGGMISTDSGRTWHAGYSPGLAAFEFKDREVISLGPTREVANGVFTAPVFVHDGRGGGQSTDTCLINVKEAVQSTTSDGRHKVGPAVGNSILQLGDGSLLMTMFGDFSKDSVRMVGYPAHMFKYRTWVVRSTDRGRTWNYLSTVTSVPSMGVVGFCEPTMVALPGGRILCIMRTAGESPAQISPLFESYSSDQGKTWTAPKAISDRGVFPNACLMDNGVLALTYGRPGDWLQFSLDEGETWIGRLEFFDGPSSGYNSLTELAPDRLLVVYNRMTFNANGDKCDDVFGMFIHVERR